MTTPIAYAATTTFINPVSFDLTGALLATGITVRDLQRAIKARDLVAHYRGTKPIITRDELQAFVEALPTERK
jgi:hypothetical protein